MIWEVFRSERKGQPFEHAGSVVAPDVEFAEAWAREQYGRRGESAAAVLLARPCLSEVRVRGDDRAGVLERLPAPLAAEDLPDHAASTASRTQRSCSMNRERNASRSSVIGP